MAYSKYFPTSAGMSFSKFKDFIRCVGCGNTEVKGMAMLKCMHFICNKKNENEQFTCLHRIPQILITGPDTATEDSSETSQKLFECRLCKMSPEFEDIEKNQVYTQEVLKLFLASMAAWDGGRMIKIKCDACGDEHVCKNYVEGFSGIFVCTRCNPKPFVCFKCRGSYHSEPSTSHHKFNKYEDGRDEWDALCNTLRMFPEYTMDASRSGPAGTSGPREPQGHNASSDAWRSPEDVDCTTIMGNLSLVPLEQCQENRQLLALIDFQIDLELTFKPKLYATLQSIKEYREIMCTSPWLIMQKTESVRDANVEKLSSRQASFDEFFLRTIIHNKILKLLIQVYPEKQGVWQAIQQQFSVLAMIENSGLAMTEIWRNDSDLCLYEKYCVAYVVVVPFFIKSSYGYHHSCKEGIYEAITARVPKPRLTPTIKISVAKLDSRNYFCEMDPVKQQYAYEEVTDVSSRGLVEAMILRETNALRCVQVALRLYACSSHEAVELIRISANQITIRERYKLSEDGEMFGEGLRYDGGCLYALLVGSKTVVCWEFASETFIVNKQYIRISESQYDFLSTDSFVKELGCFCICFDFQHPSRHQPGMSGITSQIIGLSQVMEGSWSRHIHLRGLTDTPTLQRPLIVGNQPGFKLTLIERTQEGNNLVIQSEDRSWFKVRFQFDQQPPLLVTDAWLSERRPHFLYVMYQLPDSPHVDVAAAAAPGAQKFRKIRIKLAAGLKANPLAV